MKRCGYSKYVKQMVDKTTAGAIILPGTIATGMAKEFGIPRSKALALCNLNLGRLVRNKAVVRLHKGIYCPSRQTVFGLATPSEEPAYAQMLMFKDGKVIGYETGASGANRLGLSTMMPKKTTIVTNRYRTRLPEGCLIIVRKPRVKVDNKNWKYLQFCDIVDQMPHLPIDAGRPGQVLRDFAKQRKLDPMLLITFANRYYSKKTTLRLVELLADA